MFYSNQNTPILIWIWLLYLDQVGFQQPESSTMYYVTRYQNVISNLKKKYFFSRKKMLKKEFQTNVVFLRRFMQVFFCLQSVRIQCSRSKIIFFFTNSKHMDRNVSKNVQHIPIPPPGTSYLPGPLQIPVQLEKISMEFDCSRFHAFFTRKFGFCYITFLQYYQEHFWSQHNKSLNLIQH